MPVVISPACAASDGASIYAIAFDAVPDDSYANSNKYHYVLVKSNPNPSPTLSDISWTLVSSVRSTDPLNSLKAPYSMDDVACTIDDKTKVFTALSNNEKLGIQYQPDSNGGAGTWVNVKTSTAYTWDGSSTELHYYNSADGSKTLMHATLNSVRGVLVSAMDNPTMTMNQSPAQWSFNLGAPVMSIAFAGNNMYQFTASYLTANLHAIPIPTASAQPPNGAGIKSFPAKVVTDVCNANGYYVTMRGLGDTVVISCSPSDGKTTRTFLFEGTTVTPVRAANGTAIAKTATAVMGSNNIPFLFMSNQNGLYSIPLKGPDEGAWRGANKISVDVPFSTGGGGSGGSSGGSGGGSSGGSGGSGSGGGSSGSNGSNGSKSGDPNTANGSDGEKKPNIVPAVIAVVAVLVIGVLGFVWYRKRAARKNRFSELQPTTDHLPSIPAPAPVPVPVHAAPATEIPMDQGMKLEDPSYPGQQAYPLQPLPPTPALPFQHPGTLPPLPPYQAPATGYVGVPMPQSWQSQDQIEEQIYQAHPQPKVATTGASDDSAFVPPPPSKSPQGPTPVMQPSAPQGYPVTTPVFHSSSPQGLPTVSAPQGYTAVSAPQGYSAVSAPQALPHMPAPQGGYYHDDIRHTGAQVQQPFPPMPSPPEAALHSSRTGQSAPQYRE